MKLDEKQIKENWEDLLGRIKNQFSGERQEKLLEMYNHFADRIMFAPASSREHYHNCFVGGYVDHVLRVMDCAFDLYNSWMMQGAHTDDYTLEELMFAALNHDLGKIGDLENEAYIPNPSEWHRKNQGKIYDPNPNIQHMTVPHRSIWLLSNFGIKFSQNEMIAILTHDGVYDSANDAYLKPYGKEKALWNNLPIVLHHADHMASRIEYENWKFGNKIVESISKNPKPYGKKPKVSTANDNAADLFKDLFGDNK